jgi:hypothetical protein
MNDKADTRANDKADTGANDKTNNKNNKTTQEVPTFDWVTERSSCTLPKVFAALRQQVEADVKTRNDLRPNNAPYEFSLTVDTTEFTVHFKAKEVQRSVTFSLGEREIAVRNNDNHNDKDGATFKVTLIFNDQGECRLLADEKEREYWQIRRMALEDLMFRREQAV